MSRNSAPQVSSVSASTVATKSRTSSPPRGEADGAGACVTGGGVPSPPWRITLGSNPKKSASTSSTIVPMPPPATSGTLMPRRSSTLSLCLPPIQRTAPPPRGDGALRCNRGAEETGAGTLQHGRGVILQVLLYPGLVDLDRRAGAFVLQEHGHARIALAPAAVERLRHLHQRQLAQPHRHPVLAADGGGQAHVLVRQTQREARRLVLVLQIVVAESVIEPLTAVGALAHRLPQRRRLEARLHPHREDLGQRRLHRVARAVVHELGDRACTDSPD